MLRDDAAGVSGIEGNLSNSTVERVWIQHNKVGLWVTRSFSQSDSVRHARISNVRVRDVWADGINFHFGTSQSVVTQSSIRNTGDDGLAMWSDTYMNTGNVFQNNTVQLPGLANGIAIYGGSDNQVLNNVVADTVDNGACIAFGTDFNPPALSGGLTIANNRLDRCGSFHHDRGIGIGAIWAYWQNSSGKIQNLRVSVSGNQIRDSSFAGILIEQPSPGASVSFDRNVIVNPGTYGVEIRNSAAGAATFTQTSVSGARSGNLLNSAGGNFSIQGSGNPW